MQKLLSLSFTNQWGEGNKILKGEGGIGIDFLLIDHDKDSYLADLNHLETSGMIHQETSTVFADNVIFAKIDKNYMISYMKQLAMQGIVRSKTIESIVEYSAADVSSYECNEELFKEVSFMNLLRNIIINFTCGSTPLHEKSLLLSFMAFLLYSFCHKLCSVDKNTVAQRNQ
jgi:hypothetical protein